MNKRDLNKRPITRTAYCRGCDGEMESGEIVIATYSSRNRGQHIFFCLACAKEIGQMACAE